MFGYLKEVWLSKSNLCFSHFQHQFNVILINYVNDSLSFRWKNKETERKAKGSKKKEKNLMKK